MPSIADTIRHLHAVPSSGTAARGTGRLRPLTRFGSDPGQLNGWSFVPNGTALGLVVVLHGCTQSAAGYDAGSGWSALAAAHGFAVMFVEQMRANNANLCFNWFEAEDTRRGGGEAESIRQMVAAMIDRHAIDPARVFVTGLSAGGAMASVMLATYPEVFAGGGIIAGLPYGAAASVPQALERMRGRGHADDRAYADRVRAASSHVGPWPTISVWHGDADRTVTPDNSDRIVGQWRALHGTGVDPDRTDMVDGQHRRVWLDRDGRSAIEAYRIAGMGHGTPLATGGPDGCGAAGAHMIEAGISSTRRLAASWGLLGTEAAATRPAPVAERAATRLSPAVEPRSESAPSGIQETIERALRAAGLMA